MTQEHPITPPPKLVNQWCHQAGDEIKTSPQWFQKVATQAARWGADQQLEQDARWLDTCALFSTHLTITPPGDALRQAMRTKPPSLKEQALCHLESFAGSIETLGMDSDLIRRALEQLDD